MTEEYTDTEKCILQCFKDIFGENVGFASQGRGKNEEHYIDLNMQCCHALGCEDLEKLRDRLVSELALPNRPGTIITNDDDDDYRNHYLLMNTSLFGDEQLEKLNTFASQYSLDSQQNTDSIATQDFKPSDLLKVDALPPNIQSILSILNYITHANWRYRIIDEGLSTNDEIFYTSAPIMGIKAPNLLLKYILQNVGNADTVNPLLRACNTKVDDWECLSINLHDIDQEKAAKLELDKVNFDNYKKLEEKYVSNSALREL